MLQEANTRSEKISTEKPFFGLISRLLVSVNIEILMVFAQNDSLSYL